MDRWTGSIYRASKMLQSNNMPSLCWSICLITSQCCQKALQHFPALCVGLPARTEAWKLKQNIITRMWANAQGDGRPAKHRWRPLFNAVKFGRRPLYYMPCSNAAKTRNQLKFGGVPQTNETISATSGPKFTILWGHVEDILLLNKFFFRLSICALVAKI